MTGFEKADALADGMRKLRDQYAQEGKEALSYSVSRALNALHEAGSESMARLYDILKAA